jgi:hypothetical protein
MSMSSHLLKRAVVMEKRQEDRARKIFETIVHNDRQNESAWICTSIHWKLM